jgi:hypothetical protein
MGRSRPSHGLRYRLLAVFLVVIGAGAVLTLDGSDEERPNPRTPQPSARSRPRPARGSPAHTAPPSAATGAPAPAAARASAREFLTRYLALQHGRGSTAALRPVAAEQLLQDLRRSRPRVTPRQELTRSRLVHLSTEVRSATSARALATVKDQHSPPSALALYLERRGTRWVATRIADW